MHEKGWDINDRNMQQVAEACAENKKLSSEINYRNMEQIAEACAEDKKLSSESYEVFTPHKNNHWYQTKNYDRFWKMYQNCMFYAHKHAYSRCLEIEDNTAATLYNMVKAPWPGRPPSSLYSSAGHRKKRSTRKSRKNRKQKEKRKKKKLKTSTVENCFVLTDDDTLQVQLQEGMQLGNSQDEDIIDNEFLAFMEKSMKHRIKWNSVKEIKKQEEKNPFQKMLIDESEHPSSFQEHPDVIRSRELKTLYGVDSAQIHAMETAMQLSFDRISTLHQPAVWPNIPLKLVF